MNSTETPEGEQVVVQIELLKPKDQFVSYFPVLLSPMDTMDATTSNFDSFSFPGTFNATL